MGGDGSVKSVLSELDSESSIMNDDSDDNAERPSTEHVVPKTGFSHILRNLGIGGG
jgi:hypothetical protein